MNAHEEKELISSVENEEWDFVSDADFLKKRLMQAASETTASETDSRLKKRIAECRRKEE